MTSTANAVTARPGRPTERFAVADAVRAAAIGIVVLSHLLGASNLRFMGRAHNFEYLGEWGVAAFFVLSGYLLSAPYLRGLVSGAGAPPSPRLFLWRRFLRIVPLYAVAVFASAAIVYGSRIEAPSLASFALHLFMLQDFFVDQVQTLNGPLWTMPVDVEFYLALPVLAWAAFGPLHRFLRENPVRSIAVALTTIALLSFVLRWSVVVVLHYALTGEQRLVFLNNAAGMAAIFCLGIGVALLSLVREGRPLSPGVATCCLFIALSIFVVDTRIIDYRHPWDLSAVLERVFLPLLDAFPVCLVLVSLPAFAVVRRLAETRVVAVAASLAYPTYLIHLPVMLAVHRFVHTAEGPRLFVELTVLSAAIVLPLAYVGHRFVELPFLRMKDRARDRPLPAAARGPVGGTPSRRPQELRR